MLVTAAGAGASNNIIRSLKTGDGRIVVVGFHSDRFILKKSIADRNYVLSRPTHERFRDQVCHLIERERVGLVMPTGDYYVRLFSRLRHGLPCRVFLPPDPVIDLCQDKYRLTMLLASKGVPVPATYPVDDVAAIDEVFARLSPSDRIWCRARSGSGSAAAIPVRSAEHVRGWIRYWDEMRGIPATMFTLSAYLPGRDFACQSLWRDGQLVLVKTYERLSYFDGESRPSGVSSMAGLAKTVFEPRVVEISTAAIRALGARMSGAFEVDLKEDPDGTPCVTEINAGRLFGGTNLFDLTGKFNMAVTYVRLALGERVEINEPYDVEDDCYMVREVDTTPDIFRADQLFEGICELELTAAAAERRNSDGARTTQPG